ncbi:peptidoglycan-recognition protein 2-like [Macrosteles quadrilineatus]|uniref:peptidoglycan-recognition protein 2-like n=1 Tax=Macrosteles quadrilineatus TaxID=74068 RepID=UPI0023E0E682|nr:peptidoglycan-recognition protein 2-like [Macrosteles quadrilineatus]
MYTFKLLQKCSLVFAIIIKMKFAEELENSEKEENAEDNFDYAEDTSPLTVRKYSIGHGWTIPIMHRVGWGALQPPSGAIRIMHKPVTHIRLTDTGTEGCDQTHECARIVQDFQRGFMNLGFPDQPYNFLIGGEGTVFVGRGWYRRAMTVPGNILFNEKCVEIAYIGDYRATGPTTDMLFTALDLIKYGVKNYNVHPFFKFIEYKPIALS